LRSSFIFSAISLFLFPIALSLELNQLITFYLFRVLDKF
jgi:hypothetical protein